MKRLGSELSGQLDPKRTRQGNEDVQAAQSGALATNNEQGLVNQELSSLPEQTLLVTGQALGKSAATNQARQINASIANTVGQTEGVVTNAALNTDLSLHDQAAGGNTRGEICRASKQRRTIIYRPLSLQAST